ncbi:tyrosine-type recombinase/integrase [Candidatus Peregrinibacteria bacterium]|jgi:site-specific recombinase XerD|nr:tyrosine-type recombinase/integrase [Candidatus Peregrinibacteria bacterium]
MERIEICDLLEKFLSYGVAIRNYHPATVKKYRSTFRMISNDMSVQYLDELNARLLEEWFFYGRTNRKWSAVTFRHYLKHINVVMKWLIKRDYLEENYVQDLEKPKMEIKLPRNLSVDKAKLILDGAFHMKYRYRFEKYRNRAVIAIMLLAGLRRCEVVNLKLNDISLENRMIFVNQGKGSKDRMLPMNARLHTILSEYMRDRERLGEESIHFFISLTRGKPFGERGITNLICKLKKLTGVYFSSHMLRHTFATLMLEGGCDIYTLSKLMGHAKITTTTIYLSCSNAQMGKSIEMHVLN